MFSYTIPNILFSIRPKLAKNGHHIFAPALFLVLARLQERPCTLIAHHMVMLRPPVGINTIPSMKELMAAFGANFRFAHIRMMTHSQCQSEESSGLYHLLEVQLIHLTPGHRENLVHLRDCERGHHAVGDAKQAHESSDLGARDMHVHQRPDSRRVHIRHVGEIDHDDRGTLVAPGALKVEQVVEYQRPGELEYDLSIVLARADLNLQRCALHWRTPVCGRNYIPVRKSDLPK